VKDIKSENEPIVTSFFLQYFSGVSNAAPWDCPYEKLWGEDYVYEHLLGLKFRISPAAFFQVNTTAAAILYSQVGEWCGDISDNTTVLDICCGTGTIGLTLAKRVSKVVGIEMVEDAVKDAIYNANLNGVTNCDFVAGKAEDVLEKTIRSIPRNTHLIGIVDPPRNGLHPSTIRAIRNCAQIDILVYVSCKQSALVEDAAALCRSASNKQTGEPFRPISAIAVDLFPHTPHCELVMLFWRASKVSNSINITTTTSTLEKDIINNEQDDIKSISDEHTSYT